MYSLLRVSLYEPKNLIGRLGVPEKPNGGSLTWKIFQMCTFFIFGISEHQHQQHPPPPSHQSTSHKKFPVDLVFIKPGWVVDWKCNKINKRNKRNKQQFLTNRIQEHRKIIKLGRKYFKWTNIHENTRTRYFRRNLFLWIVI